MPFQMSTNIPALQSYNSLSKVMMKTSQAQLRLATGKRINSVADDTSGFNTGKSLEAKKKVMQSYLNNAGIAQNFLSTAESSLIQVNDLITQIKAKAVDAKDAVKDTSSIANDIRSMAKELDSILKNTKFQDQNLLAESDGSALSESPVFDIQGNVTMDYATNSYLNVDALTAKISGSTTSDGVASYDGASFSTHGRDTENIDIDSVIEIKYADGTSDTFNYTAAASAGRENIDLANDLGLKLENDTDFTWQILFGGAVSLQFMGVQSQSGKNIVSMETTSGYNITDLLGLTYSAPTTTTGGLQSLNDSEVLAEAGTMDAVQDNVKSSLGRIANLMQKVEARNDFLTSSIVNSESSISRLMDADVAQEQLNATKGSIAMQASTSMLSQANTSPQQMLQLFQ